MPQTEKMTNAFWHVESSIVNRQSDVTV